MKRNQIISCLLLFLLTTAVNRVGATTYRLQRVTSVETGQKYVFEQCGYVMNNSISSNALQTTSSFNTTGLTGSEAYVWTLETASGGYKMKNVIGEKYLANASSTSLSLVASSSASVWSFNFQADGSAFITKDSGTGLSALGYKSPSLANYDYKAYSMAEWGYQPHSIVVYQLVEETGASSKLSFDTKFVKLVKGNALTKPSLSTVEGFDGTITYSSSNTKVATVDPVTGDVLIVGSGHALITASSASTATYDAGEATYTIVVMDGDGSSAKPFSAADFQSGFLGSSNGFDKYVKGYVVGYYISSTGTLSESASDDKTIYIADIRDGATVSVAVPISLASGIQSSYGLKSHPEYMGLLLTANGTITTNNASKKTALSAASISFATSYPVTVSSAKYATYRTSVKLDFTTTGLQAYTVVPSATQVMLQPIEDGIVPAGKAVVLYGEPDTYDVPVTETAATVTETGLSISDGSTAKGDGVYVLTKKNEAVGFGRWTSASSLSKGKVYLKYPAEAPEFLSLSFGDVSAIGAVPATKAVPADSRYYNLQGQQVAHPRHGVYVVNGQKVIIK